MANNFSFCTTERKISKETFIWTIPNFSLQRSNSGEFLESTIFISFSPSAKPLKWRLKIYPNGNGYANGNGYVSMYINLVECGESAMAEIEFSIRDSKGVDKMKTVLGNRNFAKNVYDGIYQFIKRDELFDEANGLLPDDCLTIVCQVVVEEYEVKLDKIDDFEIPESHIGDDIGKLFGNDKFTDCTVVSADNEEFKVHKCILAARSPVFAAMFEHEEMTETQEGIVNIYDIDSAVLEQMLRFIYNGTAPVLDKKDLAEGLLEAADKYELKRLKLLCERELAHSVSAENACELLILAKRHSAKNLKTQAIKYIKIHGKEVVESDGWKMLIKEKDADLIGQLMI